MIDIVIPSKNEIFLKRTIEDVLEKAELISSLYNEVNKKADILL